MIKALQPIRVNGNTCSIGDIIETLDKKEEQRLIDLGVAELVNSKDIEDETLTIEELRAKADELGIEYVQNIGAKKLAAKIAEFEEANK